ncbi:MAG: hypothetical protein PQJ59_11900 [Spirochaetales bacterium]|nr:hypothetical protein [Spirochaetales bacterium]
MIIRRFTVLFLFTLILFSSCGGKAANLVGEAGKGEFLSCSVSGSVRSRTRKNRNWENLIAGTIIKEGGEIRIDEGELYLGTEENILMRLGSNTEASLLYSGKDDLTTIMLNRGELAVENPGVNLEIQLPHMTLYSREGFFSLRMTDERVEVYNRDGELRMLPGIDDRDKLAEIIKDEDRLWAESLEEEERPLFPGETWYIDDETLRIHNKRYEQLILDYQGLEPDRIDLEDLVRDILTIELTISEYNRDNYNDVQKGFDHFRKEKDVPRYRLSLLSDEGTLISTDYNQTRERVDLILDMAQLVDVEISKPGYSQITESVGVNSSGDFTDKHYFKLPRLTSRTIAIEVTPPQSEITINGIYGGKGNIVLDVKPDEPLEVNFTLEGYNELYLYLDIEQDWPDTIQLELKKTIEKVLRGAYQEITGITAEGEDIYIADWTGRIWYLHEPSAWLKFNNRTYNYPNNYSAPVITDNYIYFSGKRSLVVMNRMTGVILTTTRMNDRENHLNGQKTVPMDYQVLYPTKDSLRFLTGDGKKIREVFIPGGSLMTPALYEGNIYTAATDGQIYEISSTGKILRSLESGLESPMGQSIVFDEGRGYLCDSEGQVAAFSPSSMSLEWVSNPHEEKRNFIHNVQLSEDRLYYYGGDTLFVLDRNTGKALPSLAAKIQTYPLLHGSFIYAMTGDETMTVYSSQTGESVKRIELGYEITTPIYEYDERIMAGAFDGNLLIMNQLDPSLLSKPIK